MGPQILRTRWCSLFFLILFAVSCTLNLELKKPKGEKEFFQETSRLEKLAREDPAVSVRAKSHLQLAFLYVDCRNPQLNYTRALQAMESYLFMSPDKSQKDDVQNWHAVLKRRWTVSERVRKGWRRKIWSFTLRLRNFGLAWKRKIYSSTLRSGNCGLASKRPRSRTEKCATRWLTSKRRLKS